MVFGQDSEIVNNAEVLIDDVFLCRSGVPRGNNVVFLGTACDLQKEFEDADGGLSGGRGALQKFDRSGASEKGAVFWREN